MQILDFEFDLPSEFRIENVSSAGESGHIDIVGRNAASLAAAVAEQAVTAGFAESEREAGRITLDRGEQWLVLVHDSERLTIHTRDPTILPRARFEGSAVLLGRWRFDCGTTSIAPLRERDSHGPRRGAWRLSAVSAPDVMDRVLASAQASGGLKRGAAFGPPKGGRPVWSGEAYSQVVLVKVHATIEVDGVLLEIDLVDHRADAGRYNDGAGA